jgi:hypothetical protein
LAASGVTATRVSPARRSLVTARTGIERSLLRGRAPY